MTAIGREGAVHIMRVVVTGGSGFVGAALCRELLARGHEVRAAVRRASAPRGADVVPVADIAGEFDRRALLEGADAVVHLAAIAHRDGVSEEALRRVNVDAAVRLAEAASATVPRFVFVSSVKVHGERSPGRPFVEEDPLRPQDAYGRSKAEAESALRGLAARTGLELVVVRPPLVYGPGVKANFRRLLDWIDRGVPLPLASVRNRRSLVYVGNLADAIVRCATHGEARGAFLVADAESVSTPALVRGVAAALGRPPRLLPVPPALLHAAARLVGRGPDLDRLTGSLEVDTSRARAQLDWRPPFTLAQGLADTARWYRGADARAG